MKFAKYTGFCRVRFRQISLLSEIKGYRNILTDGSGFGGIWIIGCEVGCIIGAPAGGILPGPIIGGIMG